MKIQIRFNDDNLRDLTLLKESLLFFYQAMGVTDQAILKEMVDVIQMDDNESQSQDIERKLKSY